MDCISISGMAIIRQGGITSPIMATGALITGPTGSIITGRITQAAGITTRNATTGGTAHTITKSAAITGATGM